MLNIKDKYLFLIVLVLLVVGIIYLNKANNSDLVIDDTVLVPENIYTEENDEGENSGNIVTPPKENILPQTGGSQKITLTPDNKEGSCKSLGGVWYDGSQVCEINSFNENQCIDKGGEWNPCASACRHDKDAEVCTLQCVLTCSFR